MSVKLAAWWSLAKATSIADLLFKMAAFLAALAAGNFFFFNPKLHMTTFRQSFVDESVLREAYAPGNLPTELDQLVREYNQDNAADLAAGRNTTADRGASYAELCQQRRDRIVELFGTKSCLEPNPRFGEGFTYERRMIERVNPSDWATAVRNLYRATYFTSRATVRNTGNGKAINVRVGVPSGYRGLDAFSVEADGSSQRDYETERGLLTPRPSENFSIDWEKDKAINTGLVTIVAVALVVFFALAVLGDYLRFRPDTG